MANLVEIYNHRTEIQHYLNSKIGNECVAEELTDLVIEKAQRYPFNADKNTTLGTWLRTISNSVLVDYTRTRKNVYSVSAFTDENGKETFELVAEETTDNSELKNRLATAFNNLKPNYKRIAIMYFKKDMQYSEIAEICQIPMGTVKGMISRCREMLQAELKSVKVAMR